MSSSKSTYSRKLVFILYRKFLIIFGINGKLELKCSKIFAILLCTVFFFKLNTKYLEYTCWKLLVVEVELRRPIKARAPLDETFLADLVMDCYDKEDIWRLSMGGWERGS